MTSIPVLTNFLLLFIFQIANCLGGSSFTSHSSLDDGVSCKCAPRPVKYVAIEIPKIIKVTAPAPNSPPTHYPQIIPITFPFVNQFSVPSYSPLSHLPSLPPSSASGW